jgi:hypothetical protein
MADQKPLVLDADGTFLRTDMLLESFWAGLGKDPIRVIRTSFANPRRFAARERSGRRIGPRIRCCWARSDHRFGL